MRYYIPEQIQRKAWGNGMSKPLKKMHRHKFREDWPLYVLWLPGVVFLAMFCYVPMAGSVLAFKQYNFRKGLFGSPWADPIYKNFQFFFNNIDMALRAVRNTVMFNVLFFVFTTLVAVAIAIMLSEMKNRRFVKITQSVMFFPYFISWLVLGSIFYSLLNTKTGMLGVLFPEGYDVYMKPWMWLLILTLGEVWRSAGYTSVIYYGVINGFDMSMYEAARVDGASRMQQIRHITLPLLKPTVIIMMLLATGNMLRGNLSMIIGTTNCNPLLLETVDLIDVYVYRSGVKNGEMAFASAVSLFQSVFGCIVILITNGITRKINPESSLF